MEFAYFLFDLKAFCGLPSFSWCVRAGVCHREDDKKEQLGIHGTTLISDGFVCILGNSKTNAPYIVYNVCVHPVGHRTVIYLMHDPLSQSEDCNPR